MDGRKKSEQTQVRAAAWRQLVPYIYIIYMYVYIYICICTWGVRTIGGYPEIIHFSAIFHYKPSILGYLHYGNPMKPPYTCNHSQ